MTILVDVSAFEELLALTLFLPLVGIVFGSVRDVMFFIWGWVRGLIIVLGRFMLATITSTNRAFQLATTFAGNAFSLVTPWASQLDVVFTALWDQVMRRTVAPTISTVKKVAAVQDETIVPSTTGATRLGRLARDLLKFSIGPFIAVVDRLRVMLFRVRGAAVSQAATTETVIAAQASRATLGYAPLTTAANAQSDDLNHFVDEDGNFQMRTLVASVAQSAAAIWNMFGHGALQEDPTERNEEFMEEHPLKVREDIFRDIASGQILEFKAVTEGLETFREFVALEL